jgi:hypothetical protein
MVIAIPASSVIMGVVMLVLAITTYDGLVTDDYYKQGLQINRLLERDAAAERHGLSSEVLVGASGGVIEVQLKGHPPFEAPEAVDLRLFHATRPGMDRHLVLRRVSAGHYLSRRPDLAPGKWYLQLNADDWRLRGEFEGGEAAGRLLLGRAAAGGY